MALSDILDKIEKETELKIKAIFSDFEKEKEALEKEFEGKKLEIEKNINNSIEEKNASIMEKALSLSHRENQNNLLYEKQKLIEECLNEAIEKISNSKDYTEILTKIIKKIPFDKGSIISAKSRKSETENALKASEKDFTIEEDEGNFNAGIIFKSEKIEIDNCFETIIKKQLKDTLEVNLNKILFK